ncbi:Protein FAR1-RELATED SEQUENCE 5 [Bienertia sinuspersici]
MLKGDRGHHNHELLVYNEGHRQVSGLSPAAKKVVRDMTEARVKPGPILAAVKEQFPNLNPNKRHIYNCRAKLREEKAEGRNPAEQFLHLAAEHKCLFWIDSDEGVVTHTFVAHPTLVNLLCTFPFVIMMDSTYKTNRYDMPLFEMIGMSSTNENFLIGWALMKDETEEIY